MITLRKSADRGRTRTDWLDGAHSFSFGSYRDPRWRGFRALRVLNEDVIAPGTGFGPHPHAEMEILTFVLSGGVLHRDSSGSYGVIRAGEAQRMSAGTGIVHSEWNASQDAPLHLIQVWIEPGVRGLAPSHEQRALPAAGEGWVLAAAPGAPDGALDLHAEARVNRGRFAAGAQIERPLVHRHAWLQLVSGALALEGQPLGAGDGAAIEDEARLRFETLEPSELLLFELA